MAEADSTAAVQPGAPDVPFDEKTHEQKMEFMGLVVLPKMKQLFQQYDPQGFSEFKCQTCHGKDMEQVEFEMPNAVYPLPADNPIGAAKEYDPEVTAFMTDKVVPTMASLLGEEPFNTETGAGFGCFECHLKE